MFSLLITIVSIALVAALVLATLYYGGASFTVAQANAKAAQQRNQAQQLIGAAELFKARMGRFPLNIPEMVSQGYLKSVPTAQLAVGNAFAEASWRMPMAQQPVFTLVTEEPETCRSLNAQSYGAPGILPTLQANVLIQCFGSNTRSLLTVVGRNAEHLDTVANEGSGGFTPGDITGQPVPPAGDPVWTVDPETPRNVRPGPDEGEGGGEPPDGEGVLFLTPTALNFGPVATHTTSTRVVELSNVGDGALALGAVPQLSGDAAFVVAGTTCATSLPAGQSCEVSVSYAPNVVVSSATATLGLTNGPSNAISEVTVEASSYNPVSLVDAVIPAAKQGQVYSPFDFKTLLEVSNEASPQKSLATWTTQGTLPAGMSFDNVTGVLSGTPTTQTNGPGAEVSITATYKNNADQQVYYIVVGEVGFEATALASGENVTCAVTPAGDARCWGTGALGNGAWGTSQTPISVPLPGPAADVVVGQQMACARLSNGDVYCWGRDNEGQVGDGGTNTDRLSPTLISGAAGATKLAASNNTTCALFSNKTLKCWGSNGDYEFAKTSPTSHNVPTALTQPTNVEDIVASGGHFCARLSDATMRCWGRNSSGQVGNGNTTKTATPANPGLLTGVSAIAAGGQNTCAVAEGTTYCWGANGSNQLNSGAGTPTRSTVPVAVPGVTGLSQLAIGYEHVCGISTEGGVRCWGAGSMGRLGNNATPTTSGPVAVQGLSAPVVSLKSGTYHTCAAQANGIAKCWGQGGNGGLGNGSTANRLTATSVSQ